jgi:predicted SnoaL-like aldol condensation-catalyzing enzyme
MNWRRALITAAAVFLSGANISFAGNSTQEEENKRITHIWVDAAMFGHWDKIAQYMSPDFKTHDWRVKSGDLVGLKQGFDGMTKMAQAVKLEITGERDYADGDYVISHYNTKVTSNNGVWYVVGTEIFRFSNGKMVEHWNNQQTVPLMSANTNGAF